MSNILKSKRKESSFQIYIDWLKLRQRLTEYVSSDFNDSKISYNEPNSLKYPNYLYFLFDYERKQLLNLIDKIQDNITHASTADSATKATKDSTGQQINTTYIKSLSVNGRTITYTKGNGTTGTITTQDTNTTYSKLSQFTNDSGYIVGSHNFASGVTVNGYKITVG